MSELGRKAGIKLLGVVSEAEMAVRMIEATGYQRPPGKTPERLLSEMDPEASSFALLSARTAIRYMAECFANSVRPS